MKKVTLGFLLLLPVLGASADAAQSELYTCSFTAHSPSGNLSGKCTTQSLPAQEFIARWALTLIVDPMDATVAAKLQPDSFYDMVRGQCLEEGTFTSIMPLWGDLVISPDAPDYIAGIKTCTPLFQVAPNKITLTRISTDPLVLQFLYEQRATDLDQETGTPSSEWIRNYLDSFRRLQQNGR
jgi:hypothetical protein